MVNLKSCQLREYYPNSPSLNLHLGYRLQVFCRWHAALSRMTVIFEVKKTKSLISNMVAVTLIPIA